MGRIKMYLSDESLEQAREYAKAAFERMEKLSVRPVPTNFCVWYAYHTGKSPELRRAIDILISNRQPFTVMSCAAPFEFNSSALSYARVNTRSWSTQ